ncbi:MAG: hypothetical protein ACK56W_01160 [Pirellula sp.]
MIGESCCCYGNGQKNQPASPDKESDVAGPGPMLKKLLAFSFSPHPKETFCGSSTKKQPTKEELSRPNQQLDLSPQRIRNQHTDFAS